MQDGRKAVWSVPYVSVAFFPSLKQNFIAYRSSKVSSRPDCIEIHQLWQSGFSRVYSNCCCSCSFEPEIIKIGQSSHKMYSNNIVNFQESTTILNACIKKCLEFYWMHHVHNCCPKIDRLYHCSIVEPSLVGLENTSTVSLQRSKTVPTNNHKEIKLFVLDKNTWNQITVYERINLGSFKKVLNRMS